MTHTTALASAGTSYTAISCTCHMMGKEYW
jgi:hypothetical protein